MENENTIPVVEEPVVPRVSVEPVKKNNLFKILVIFLGILIVLGLFANAYFLLNKKEIATKSPEISLMATPTPDVTANWTIYTNQTYGYSIKFPDTYEVPQQTEKQKSQLGVDNNVCVALKDSNTCLIIMDHWQNTIDEVVKMNLPTDGSQPQDYTVGTIKGKIIVSKMGESTTQAVIILPKPKVTNEIITLSYSNYPGDIERSKLIDQILSTFKFTNNEEPSYINESLGFSLNIPASWKDKYKANVTAKDNDTWISFDYQGKTETYMLFSINRVSNASWQEIQKDELLKGQDNYLGTNQNYVYYSTYSLDNPFTGTDGDTYHALYVDINQILSTFKVTSGQ